MGSVHKQTVNEGYGCNEFYHVSLSEINTIKSLIVNRCEFDSNFEPKIYYNYHPYITNGIPLFQEPVEVLYLDLEKLIKESKLNKYHKFIIYCLMRGYDYEFIGKFLKWSVKNIDKTFNDACEIIKDQNDYNWEKWIEVSGIIKIPNDVKYKGCNICDKDLRISNFRRRNDNYGDGFRPECKKCESRAKKIRKK